MADLSQLSDEQLQVYKDLLEKKGSASQGEDTEVPHRLGDYVHEVARNIPSSIKSAVTHPSFPGMPAGMETQKSLPKYMGGPGVESFNPLSDVPSWDQIKRAPIEDPVGSALTLAGGARGAREFGVVPTLKGAAQGAWKSGTETIPFSRYGHTIKLPKVLAGAAAGETAGWMSRLPHGPEVGAAIGAATPVVQGAYRGGREAFQKFLESKNVESLPGTGEGPQRIESEESASEGLQTPQVQRPLASQPLIAVSPPTALQAPNGQETAFQRPQIQVSLPESRLTPKGGNVEPNGRSTETATEVLRPNTQPKDEPQLLGGEKKEAFSDHPAHSKINEGLKTKIPNVIDHAKAEGYTREDLQKLHDDALDEIKTIGKRAFTRAKSTGKPTNPSSSKYKGMSLYTLGEVIKAWKD